MVILPALIFKSPDIQRTSVDFPEPLLPTIAVTYPDLNLIDMLVNV